MAEGFDIQMMITKMQLNLAVVVITLVCRATRSFRLLSSRSKGFRSAFSHSVFYNHYLERKIETFKRLLIMVNGDMKHNLPFLQVYW